MKIRRMRSPDADALDRVERELRSTILTPPSAPDAVRKEAKGRQDRTRDHSV